MLVEGRDAGSLPDAARTAIRRDTIGFVYQFHHLLAEFTALENVVLPQMIAGAARGERRAARGSLLASFGLGSAAATSAGQAVRRRTAARRDRSRSGQRAEGAAGR